MRYGLMIWVFCVGGLRIGEALSLWIEDFDIGSTCIQVRKSKTMSGEGRKVYVSGDTMNVFEDYLIKYHDVHTNSVVLILYGPKKCDLLKYGAAFAALERIRQKTK